MGPDILVSLDIAGCAHEVLDESIQLATGLGASLSLLHVTHLPEGVHRSDVLHLKSADGAAAEELLDQDARNALTELEEICKASEVPCRLLIRHGAPAEAILATAESVRPRYLVLGTHGRTGLRRALMGSVAEEVLRHATVPVFIVRTQALDSHPGLTATQQQVLAEADG